jgi:SH3 domain protein
MKRFSFLALALVISGFSFAEEPTSTNAPATSPIETTTVAAPAAVIGKRYIKDYILVPLRSGDTPGHKIIHKGIKSGTLLTVLKVNEASQYSLVKTSDGAEGWLPNQYLMEETPSIVKLAQAQDTITRLSAAAGPDALNLLDLQKKNDELANNLRTLEETNNALARELEHIKSVSADEVKLHEDNKKLISQYEESKRLQDTVTAENQSLESQLRQNTFINGAIAVILGILATLIIQHLTKSNKRYSDWA